MLQTLLGILGSQQARQVRIGRLWYDPANVEHVLHRYCKQLFILTGSEQFPYQFFGSSTAVKFGNRHLVLCCGHQIDSIEPDKIAIYVKAQNSTVTASSLLRPKVTTDNSDTDWIDVRALEYVVENYKTPNLSREFFAVERDGVWPLNSTGRFLLFGYPTERQEVDYEQPRIRAHVVEVGATYDGPSNSPHVHRVKMDRKVTFHADGMSGGPVFYLGRSSGAFFVGFAGIIIRGGATSEIIHFIDASFLGEMAAK